MSSPAVFAEDLGRTWSGRWVLQGVNLRLAAGRSLLLAGANGAGKTTLLRLLATALRPSAGRVQLGGYDPDVAPREARRQVALLSHRTQLWSELSNQETLAVCRDLLGLPPDATQDEALLDRVGLIDRRHTRVREDSAGMKKRLAFARLLLQDPRVVLLDEPYGQLDPQGFRFVDRFLAELQQEGRAVVVASHLVERMAPLTRYGLVLSQGRPVWAGDAADTPAALAEVLRP